MNLQLELQQILQWIQIQITNQFLRNKQISSIIYSAGTDLEEYNVFIDSNSNIFTNNDVSMAIFDLYNTEMDLLILK